MAIFLTEQNRLIDQDKANKRGMIEVSNLVPLIKEGGSYPSIYNDKQTLDGAQCLSEMGQIVVEDYKLDLASRSQWDYNASKIMKLFASFADPKSWPWPNCSNVRLPVVTIGSIQFQARAYEAILPGSRIVEVFATGDEDVKRADRVSKFMNWQLLYQMKEFCTQTDNLLMESPLTGNAFKKTFFSFEKRRPISIHVSSTDLVFPYNILNFDESPRKTHVLKMSKNDIRKRVISGVFSQEAWDLGPGTILSQPSETASAKDDVQGTSQVWSTYDNPRLILEQHREWDLNSDGVAEPYVITVDYETMKVLRITSREFIDAFNNNIIVEYFTHYYFLPNPFGAYCFGLGTLLLGLNEAMNTIVNEVIDAGSLANLQGGFVAKRAGLKKGDLKFKMGEFQEVDAYTDDIAKAIYRFDFKGPNQTLYATLGLLYEYAKLVSGVSETMTGQLPASDTPATTILALIEEGRKVYSAIYKRHHTAFGEELRKIYTLNSIFLNENEYFKVLGDNAKPTNETDTVGRSDFIGEYDVIPVSDPSIISRAEKVIVAQQILTDVRANPLTANNPIANFNATKRYYEALNVKNIDEVLPETSIPVDLSPEEENAKMLLEQSSEVLPTQDHLHHIEVHDAFVNSPIYGAELSANSRNLLERHKKEHIAQIYLAETGGMRGSQGMA